MESSVWMIIPTNFPNHHKQNFTDYLSKKKQTEFPAFMLVKNVCVKEIITKTSSSRRNDNRF